MFLASMGLYIAGINVLQLVVGSKPRSIGRFSPRAFELGAVRITAVDLVMVVLAAALCVTVILLEQRSCSGGGDGGGPVESRDGELGWRQHRACVRARVRRRLGRARPCRGRLHGKELGPAIEDGVGPIISGLVAMFLGGVGRTSGAVLGAIVLGVSQNMGGLWLPGHWQVIVSFVIRFAPLHSPARSGAVIVNSIWFDVLDRCLMFSVLAIVANLVLGLAGQMSLAMAAFFGIGAYTSAVLTIDHGSGFFFATPAAVALSAANRCAARAPDDAGAGGVRRAAHAGVLARRQPDGIVVDRPHRWCDRQVPGAAALAVRLPAAAPDRLRPGPRPRPRRRCSASDSPWPDRRTAAR